MRPAFWQRLDSWACRMTPFGLSLVLVLLSVVPLHIPGFARVMPLLPLMAVFHWAVYRPELMPVYAVFLLGILQDALAGTPIGINAVVFLAVYGVVLAQRRFFAAKSFAIVWLGFALIAAGAAAASWVLVSSFNVTLVEAGALVYQYLLTVGVYPVLAWMLLRWQHTFLRQE